MKTLWQALGEIEQQFFDNLISEEERLEMIDFAWIKFCYVERAKDNAVESYKLKVITENAIKPKQKREFVKEIKCIKKQS